MFLAGGGGGGIPLSAILGPLAAILDFAGGSVFLIEGVLGSKNLFSESGSKWPIT